jgi:predicted nuclease with TOPRIM domain
MANDEVESLNDTVEDAVAIPVEHLTVSQRVEFLIAEFTNCVEERRAAIERAEAAESDLEEAIERADTAERELEATEELVEDLQDEVEELEDELDELEDELADAEASDDATADGEFEYEDDDGVESGEGSEESTA